MNLDPAFAIPISYYFGLTKLELFACEAMKSLIQLESIGGVRHGQQHRKHLCEDAVKYAHSLIDALLEDENARREASDSAAEGADGTGQGNDVPGVQPSEEQVPDDPMPF